MLPALLPLLTPVVGRLIDLIPDPQAREKAKSEAERELVQVLTQADQQQIEINKIEAQHQHLFVAGWRPFIGWCGGAGLAWTFIAHPILTWVVAVWQPEMKVPPLLSDNLLELVIAMLGLGGLRTYEKTRKLR